MNNIFNTWPVLMSLTYDGIAHAVPLPLSLARTAWFNVRRQLINVHEDRRMRLAQQTTKRRQRPGAQATTMKPKRYPLSRLDWKVYEGADVTPRVSTQHFYRVYAAYHAHELRAGSMVFDVAEGVLGEVERICLQTGMVSLTAPQRFTSRGIWPSWHRKQWTAALSAHCLCKATYRLMHATRIHAGTFPLGCYRSRNIGVWTSSGYYRLLEVCLEWPASATVDAGVAALTSTNSVRTFACDMTITGMDEDDDEYTRAAYGAPALDTMCLPRPYALLENMSAPFEDDATRERYYYSSFRGLAENSAEMRRANDGATGPAGAAVSQPSTMPSSLQKSRPVAQKQILVPMCRLYGCGVTKITGRCVTKHFLSAHGVTSGDCDTWPRRTHTQRALHNRMLQSKMGTGWPRRR
jgi:hypothetical protein